MVKQNVLPVIASGNVQSTNNLVHQSAASNLVGVSNQQIESLKLNNEENNNNQNPFKQNMINNTSNSISITNNNNTNNNPFGDSFSQLNDNEIFGLEFDRIRHSNEKTSTNNLNDFQSG